MEFYNQKENQYFSHARFDMISMIPKNPNNKILEIGAGGGDTLVELKRQGLASVVAGVELMQLPGTQQKHATIDHWIFGNIESCDLPFEDEHFDVILCGDVFEHLIDPWAIVAKLTSFLKIGGCLITSIPNIRIKNALFKIYFKGDFGYTSEGTFDKTHLRFFCKKNMVQMLTTESLQIVEIKRNFDLNPKNARTKFLNRITVNLFEEFLALQFLFAVKRLK